MEFFYGAFSEEWERRKAVLLHERSLGRSGPADEEERRRRGGSGGGWPAGRGAFGPGIGSGRPFARRASGGGESGRPMRMRFTAIAKGSQPAVVKMASYGAGVRLGAMLGYVSRSGEVEVEDDRGERIRSRERLASLRGEWEHLLQNREESRDVGVFSVSIGNVPDRSGEALHELVRATLSRGLGERRFAYGMERRGEGSLAVSGVVVLRGPDGERLTGDAKAASIVQNRYDTRSSADDPSAVFSFDAYGNGVDYGTAKLRRLVETFEGDVHDERGMAIGNESLAGDLVQKGWRHQLHSRKSRDVMHLIMSARAGTDVDAFKDAARDFLADQFSGHRYVFALHDPAEDPKEEAEGGKRPHVHVHAIITMKSEFGERIETSPQIFREWRQLMAEKAREHGIQMEMTDRRELARAPAYGRNQVRPISRQGRTEHVGTSEAAHIRYQTKRSELASVARAPRSVEYTVTARRIWSELARANGDRAITAYALEQENRIETAWMRKKGETEMSAAVEKFGSKYQANMVWLQAIVSEADKVREMSRPEFEAYEKHVETALFRFERLVSAEERDKFEEIASAAREHVNVRREILELNDERRALESQRTELSAEGRGNDFSARGHDDPSIGDQPSREAREASERIEGARNGIERADAEGRSAAAAEREYAAALDAAAKLMVAGNSFMREVAENNADLRHAVEALERAQGGKAAATTATAGEDERRLSDESAMERYTGNRDAEADHDSEAAPQPPAQRRTQDAERGQETTPKSGEANRTDPPQQHIPRLDELDREEQERRDRDRDDFER
ncbi:MAG: conjugal transfer protein TraA [Mesorhizobium sp.]|nr:conjugal transfer protein TraA [Mesorhizobium sp.]RWM09729.1 MAG: conjugal transfer protein TraA [Mesorhizobium sp.]